MFLLIDNYDSFTFNLVQAFLQLGRTPVVVKNDDPALPGMGKQPGLAMVCIGPGPGGPEKAGLCLEFLAALPHSVPVLGVCLGHQILGHAAGARVSVGPRIMHGKSSPVMHAGTGLFQGIAPPMDAGRYHSLIVHAEDVPDRLDVTARSTAPDGSEEVMAFRYKDRPWAGVQFHPESVLTPEGLRLLANFPSGLLGQSESAGTSEPDGLFALAALPGSAEPATAGKAAPHAAGKHGAVQMSAVIETLAKGENLEAGIAAAAFSRLMDGKLSASQAGALLLGLRAKGETPEEVGEAALAVLSRAVPVPPVQGDCIDIVGTGGDSKSSFNCSTATSLTLAGMGHKVLKHGNRSVSSRCGSADVLEQIGLPLDTPPESVARALHDEGFAFLFAPRYHPAFRHVMPVRRELGVRTLFNILGPLVNPARPTRHFLGVADPAQLSLVAATLTRISSGSGAVVCGAGGYDELTTMGEARLMFVDGGTTRPGSLDPAEYGFTPCAERDLAVEGPEHAAAVLRGLLSGEGPEAMREMLVLNLAFALYLVNGGLRKQYDNDCGCNRAFMAESVREARRAVAQGAGRRFCRA